MLTQPCHVSISEFRTKSQEKIDNSCLGSVEDYKFIKKLRADEFLESLLSFNAGSFVFQLLFAKFVRRKYKIIISHFVCMGENFFKERRLTVCENRELRKIFTFKKVEVSGDSRELNSSEFCDLYSLTNIFLIIK